MCDERISRGLSVRNCGSSASHSPYLEVTGLLQTVKRAIGRLHAPKSAAKAPRVTVRDPAFMQDDEQSLVRAGGEKRREAA